VNRLRVRQLDIVGGPVTSRQHTPSSGSA
jgi:hypothetical protein